MFPLELHHKGDRYGKQRRVLHDIADVPAGHVYYLYCHGGLNKQPSLVFLWSLGFLIPVDQVSGYH